MATADAILPLSLPVEPTDEGRALAGERAAWDTLIDRHNHRVIVALLARRIPIDRARELTQETWLRLIERQRAGRLDRLELPGLAIAQAIRIARDRARAASASRPHLPLDDAELADPDSRFDERVLSRDALNRADAVLAGCSESARRVFELIYEQPGIAHGEVAARVGLSVQRVRQILCEVRKKLRAAIEETP
jgi:RNA polymerase sigma-70 factor (ECF subfamily)